MRALKLNWRALASSELARSLFRETEIAAALCGATARFQIFEVRTRTDDGLPSTTYVARDASMLTDAQFREGKRPEIVARTDDLEKLVEWCEQNDPKQ